MTLRKMTTPRGFFETYWILIAAVPAGILVGGAYYLISNLLPFILLDTFLAALLGLGVLVLLNKKAFISRPLVAVLYAVIFTVICYGTCRFIGYLGFRNDAFQAMQTEGITNPAVAAATLDAWLVHRTGAPGFLGYLSILAETGIGITPLIGYQGAVAPVGGEMNVSGAMAWLFWLIEFLLMGGLVLLIALWLADAPFATAGVERLGSEAGNVPVEHAAEFAALLEAEAFDQAWSMVAFGGEAPHPTVEVYIRPGKGKTEGTGLVLAAITALDRKGMVRRKALFWTEVPNDEMPVLPADPAFA